MQHVISVPFSRSLGAIAIADNSDDLGLRFAHDQRFDEARNWALERLAGDGPRLSVFLCELAMFCDSCGEASKARDLFLEALEKDSPSHNSAFAPVLSAALASALAALDSGFAQTILARLPDGRGPSITLQLGGEAQVQTVSFPIDVPMPLAEDLVAVAAVSHFGRSHGAAGPLIDQLAVYLDAVNAAGERNRQGAEAHTSVSLPEIILAVLAQLAMRARRQKCDQELAEVRREIYDCLQRFGQPLSAYPESLAGVLKRFGGPALRKLSFAPGGPRLAQ